MNRPMRSDQLVNGPYLWPATAVLLLLIVSGCIPVSHVLPPEKQITIDRRITEYPTGFELKPFMDGLNGPTCMTFDDNGDLIIAEGGVDGRDPHIFGIHMSGPKSSGAKYKQFDQFEIYPTGPYRIPLINPGFRIYGPVGGIVAYRGKVYVAHRDSQDWGVITAFGYDGSHTTIVGGLPARGDYGVTSLVVRKFDNRLYFGVGTATNSGIVGLDNQEWVRKYPDFCDMPDHSVSTTGGRFTASNPQWSIFAPSDTLTGFGQPFGTSNITIIPSAPLDRPTGAIYSVPLEGGDARVEAWGVHNPAGLAVNEFDRIYFTDQGMELRGTRPVFQDPDAVLWLVSGTWYGWPDFSRSLESVREAQFQLPPNLLPMLSKTGYSSIAPLIDHEASGLKDPDHRFIQGLFPPLSGASKMAFVPGSSPAFRRMSGSLIVALFGNRAPFATSGQPLRSPPPGFCVARVDSDSQVRNFIYNTQGGPASKLHEGEDVALERPIDVKFGPDGNLYILDFGRMEMKGGHETIWSGTGKIYRLVPATIPSTEPGSVTSMSSLQNHH